jgi:mRNA-degrading endonuclease RelE of RelBE toxin-antitoxin system
MRYAIVLAPQAAQELRALPARLRSEVRDAVEAHLRHEPTKVSKSRIKRLRGIAKPHYRLRVGESRLFYDVRNETVEALAIVTKRQAERWLAAQGTPDPDSGTGEGEG